MMVGLYKGIVRRKVDYYFHQKYVLYTLQKYIEKTSIQANHICVVYTYEILPAPVVLRHDALNHHYD